MAGVAGLASAQTQTLPKPEEKKMDKAGEKKASDKKMAARNANGTVKSASVDSVVVAGKGEGEDREWGIVVHARAKGLKARKTRTAAGRKAPGPAHARSPLPH